MTKEELQFMLNNYFLENNYREDNHIHVSNLINFCPREYWLCQEMQINFNRKQKHNLATKFTFFIGECIHEKISNVFKKLNILEQAEFKLSYCIESKKFGEIKITGSCDDIIKYNDAFYLVEKKSIKDTPPSPIYDHIVQISLYLWLLQKTKPLKNIQTNKAFLIYFAKTYNEMPIKVFEVNPDKKIIKEVLDKLNQLKENKIPERICKTEKDLMAKRPCQVVKQCFKED